MADLQIAMGRPQRAVDLHRTAAQLITQMAATLPTPAMQQQTLALPHIRQVLDAGSR